MALGSALLSMKKRTYLQPAVWPLANIYLVKRGLYAFWMSEESPSRFLDKIIIRVPNGMRDRIKRVADSNNRSVNAELLVLLERTFPPETKINEYLQDVAEIVGKLPAEKRADAWRDVFDRLDALRNETA